MLLAAHRQVVFRSMRAPKMSDIGAMILDAKQVTESKAHRVYANSTEGGRDTFVDARCELPSIIQGRDGRGNNSDTATLLRQRQSITDDLQRAPYDLTLYIDRATIHAALGYPDLAVGDSYRALLLCDECISDEAEYHESAWNALSQRCTEDWLTDGAGIVAPMGGESKRDYPATIVRAASQAAIQCYRQLSTGLLQCGCLKSALEFCMHGLAAAPGDSELLRAQADIKEQALVLGKGVAVDRKALPDDGRVRREVYPWNPYEPDRCSPSTLAFLNHQLQEMAPKCEVRVAELPRLSQSPDQTDSLDPQSTTRQLGLFACTEIRPGETLLTEFSVLTANTRLKGSLCDACSTELPPLGADGTAVSCPECDDIFFCGAICLAEAQAQYHPAVCGKDVDTLAKDPTPKEKPAALYFLLLARALAMAHTHAIHPLDLTEVKYLWGDFHPDNDAAVTPFRCAVPPPVSWTLPFSFKYHVAEPLHMLEKMDVDIYARVAEFDLWIFNTLYAKFRGTASARIDPRSGHPEVAAVHPLWCLANHDCDPNVEWSWNRTMHLWCREKRITGEVGRINAGDEIRNHYCDIALKVRERREWAQGSLGGWCRCRRCCQEAAVEEVASEIS